MKRKILIIIAVVLLLAGLGFLLFAPVSNFVGQKNADSVIVKFDKMAENVVESVTAEDGSEVRTYKEAVEKGVINEEGKPADKEIFNVQTVQTIYGEEVDEEERVLFKDDLERLYDDSVAYNKMLLTGQGNADTIQYERAAFDLYDYGIPDDIYCYIDSDAIDLHLPVYLGAEYSIMSCGAAHLYGTSLPVGDDDMNIAFAGHTYYVGRIFFDHLRDLRQGDEVRIKTFWDTTYYSVIDYKIISPNDTSDLVIEKGKQLLTLITCIPDNGGGFDRYLVVCERKQPPADGSAVSAGKQ